MGGHRIPARYRRAAPSAVSLTVCSSDDDDNDDVAVSAKPVASVDRKRKQPPPDSEDSASDVELNQAQSAAANDDSESDDSDFEPESDVEDVSGSEQEIEGAVAGSDDDDESASEQDEDEDGSDDDHDSASERDEEGESDDETMADEFDVDSNDDDSDDGDEQKLAADWIDSDEDGSDGDEDDEVEAQARALDRQKAEDEADADAELRVNISAGAQESFTLPTADEREAEALLPSPDLAILKQRINKVLFVLADLKNQRQAGMSRSDYIDTLRNDLALYYGYNPDLVAKFLTMFSPAECVEFLEANATQRPMCIRANTLKVRRRDLAQALINRGVNLDPLGEWSKVGLTISSSQVPVAATPEYLAGHYMLQSPSSFLPVMALAPKENETVVDMCSAPGGKTTYLSALMKNSGCVIANDVNKDRLKATVANAHRLGAQNVLVVNYDGRTLPEHFRSVDRVLLDAPCSGLGVISKDESIKLEKTNDDILKCAQLQKELILAAIDMLKPNGTMVYSTCSISVEENESVVQFALRKRFVKIVPTGIEFGRNGFTSMAGKQFHPNMSLARRIYPHVHNMDGFFVVKLEKLQDGPRKPAKSKAPESDSKKNDVQKVEEESDDKMDEIDAEDAEDKDSGSDPESSAEESESEEESEPESEPEKPSKRARIAKEKHAAKQKALMQRVRQKKMASNKRPQKKNKM